ncbi:hypothetical protein [Streptomyces lateritius]|uniref:hypothetical protein n=1 Tax=Streptomyces lateritius TaxID=67313 RepID=UPI0016777DE1|nr:hypothetical protein [Streptomyces lateritius]
MSRSELGGRESEPEVVWTFRVERFDQMGNRVQLVPVEMRGRRFEGSVSDGDWVRARGRIRNGTLHATRITNVTTGAVVRARRVSKVMIFLGILALLAWIAWMVFVVMGIDSGPPPDFPEP